MFGSDDEQDDVKVTDSTDKMDVESDVKADDSPVSDNKDDNLFGSDDEGSDKETKSESSSHPIQSKHSDSIMRRDREGGSMAGGDSQGGGDELDEILGLVDKNPNAAKPRSSSTLCLRAPYTFNNSTAFYLRTPNFIKISTQAFDRSTYDVKEEKAAFGKATAVIRWRFRHDDQGGLLYGPDGQPLRQSNAKLVKWSDGSLQCIVGNEVFKVETPPLQNR